MTSNTASGGRSLLMLHPSTRALSLDDVAACTELEAAAFPPHERASREKVGHFSFAASLQVLAKRTTRLTIHAKSHHRWIDDTLVGPVDTPGCAKEIPTVQDACNPCFTYRFGQCGNLSMGLFITPHPDTSPHSSDSAHKEPNPTLIAHICSTLTDSDRVTDESMALPSPQAPANGHREHGRTLCIHSLAVLPSFQGIGAGTMLMDRYLRTMADENLADRAAIIAHDHLIPYYERFGFVNLGPSQAQFGGGGWYDMVKDFAA